MATSRIARGSDAGMVSFKKVCRRIGIHPNSGYKYHHEGRFPIEVITLGDRLYCRAVDVDTYLGDRSRAAG